MAARLGMQPMSVPARTIGDHQAEYVTLLGLLAATAGKIGREIYTLMKQEFGEVEEPVPAGTVGSSTMPQKRNPKLSQDIIAAAAQIRALVPLALDAMHTEHEADRTTSIMMGRALVQACELTGDMLQRMISLFDGLQVFPARMRQNLDLSGGLIMAEALMLELGKQIGRQRAHDAVYDAAQGSVNQARPFRDLLAEDPHVSGGLTPAQVDALLDPARYAGLCSQFAERGAAKAREVAATLGRLPRSWGGSRGSGIVSRAIAGTPRAAVARSMRTSAWMMPRAPRTSRSCPTSAKATRPGFCVGRRRGSRPLAFGSSGS